MKTNVFIAMMLISSIMFAQKSKNGTVYKEHPAITTVESMMKAFFAGDAEKVGTYLADDFKAYSGSTPYKNEEGRTKENMLAGAKWVSENWSYISYERSAGAYPDAIEYKDDEDGLWVQTWDHLKAMHNITGVKIDIPVHRLYRMKDDNTILNMFTYDSDIPFENIRDSRVTRTNGTIYNSHENINTVRKMIGALENADLDKAFSYFTENAQFSNLDMGRGDSHGVAEEKEALKTFLKDYTIDSIDVIGYPDYLEYEIWDSRVVQSWWDLRVTRKKDNKKFVIPAMLTHNFNEEGKITRETGYYTMSALSAK